MKMSVDAFGRVLKRFKGGGERGPPGLGYKLTSDGHFDVDNKKLCNLADPSHAGDAVNLKILKTLIESEIKDIFKITTSLREEIDNLLLDLKKHRSEIDENVTRLYIEIQNARSKEDSS